jgi:hypothetical protein
MSNLGRLDLVDCDDSTGVDLEDIMPVLPAHSLTALSLYKRFVELPDSASRLVNLRELDRLQSSTLSHLPP